MSIFYFVLAFFLMFTETVFVAPLLDMANIPDHWQQLLVAFGLVSGCVMCLEYAIGALDKAKGLSERIVPALIFIFLFAFLTSFGLMRGLMTYTLSHGQLQMFLMGSYWLNLVFWGLITFLPPLSASLALRHARRKGEQ